MSYLHTNEGYLYLAAIADQYLKENRGILYETTVDPGIGH